MTQPANRERPVVCAGILVADHLSTPISHVPAAGELVPADDLILNLGGCAANASVALKKLGVETTVCGKVGDDILGRFVSESLVGFGLDVAELAIDPVHATSQSLIINVAHEDRRFVHSFGANRGFTVADLERVLKHPPKVLYLGGYLLLPGLDPQGLADCFARARSLGCLTVLDVGIPGPGEYLPALECVLKETDVFLPNDDESALILKGESDLHKQALIFHDLGARRVVITCGEHGSVYVSKDHRLDVGTYPVEFVDGTGGGDAFDAGYIAGLVDGLDELACLKLASAVGASCVRAVGTTAGIFTRAEAERFILENELSIKTF